MPQLGVNAILNMCGLLETIDDLRLTARSYAGLAIELLAP